MSNDDAYKIEDEFERWDEKNARHNFLAKMERKYYRKEHAARS